MNPRGAFTTLQSFNGSNAIAGLPPATDGNFYRITEAGRANGACTKVSHPPRSTVGPPADFPILVFQSDTVEQVVIAGVRPEVVNPQISLQMPGEVQRFLLIRFLKELEG
jgi:hypothetical protein